MSEFNEDYDEFDDDPEKNKEIIENNWDVTDEDEENPNFESKWEPNLEKPPEKTIDKRKTLYSDEYVQYWVDLYREHKTFEKVRKVLRMEEKKVPGLYTIQKRMKLLLGSEEYKKLTQRKKYSFKDIIEIVKQRSIERTGVPGKLLSKKEDYKLVKSKLKFQCGKCNYIWETTFDTLFHNDSWCMKCAHEKIADSQRGSIGEHLEIIEEKNGRLLDIIYDNKAQKFNQRTKFKVECLEDNYVFEIRADSLKNDHWCKMCGNKKIGEKLRGSIMTAQNIAKDRGGICLSKPEEYKNQHQKLKFHCGVCETEFERNTTNLNRGDWCPTCNQGKWEEICRSFFEEMFNDKFPKKKPNWLNNSRGNQMELDGFNEKLKLAFEYQGEQHYRFTPFFHKTIDDFNRVPYFIRINKLQEFIRVPYFIRINKLQEFITNEYQQLTGKKMGKIPMINYNKFMNKSKGTQTSLDKFK